MVHVGAPAGSKAAHPPRRRQSPPQRPIRACRRSYRGRERGGPRTHAEARRCMYERLSRRSSYQRRITMVHVGAPAGAKAAHPPHRRQSPPQRPIRACRRSYRGRERDGPRTHAEARRCRYERLSTTVLVPTPKHDGSCRSAGRRESGASAPPTPIATSTPHSRLPALLPGPRARRSMYQRRSATVHVRTPKQTILVPTPKQTILVPTPKHDGSCRSAGRLESGASAPPTPIATSTPHSRLPALLQGPQARRSTYPRRSATVQVRTPKHDGPRTNAEARWFM